MIPLVSAVDFTGEPHGFHCAALTLAARNGHAALMPEDTTHSSTPQPAEPAQPETSKVLPVVILSLVALALLGAFITLALKNRLKNPFASHPSELTTLEAEATAIRSQLNRERMAMGLRPLEGGSEPMEDIAARMKKDADTMVALASSFQSMLGEKDVELTAKNSELLRSEQLRQSLAAESARLQGELQKALVASSGADQLKNELANAKNQRDALSAELAARGKGASAEDLAELQRRFDETQRAKEFFEAKVKTLEEELAKAKLFANSENELLPDAVELFRSLRQLEGKPDSEMTTAYSSLAVKLGANVRDTLKFDTGTSAISPQDEATIRHLAEEIPDGDLLLAIGYASETGNVDGNRTLSSDRATAAAQLYSSVKRPGQLVQAVYLGQTDRFSSRIPERNQLVEIWQIRKK